MFVSEAGAYQVVEIHGPFQGFLLQLLAGDSAAQIVRGGGPVCFVLLLFIY